MEPSKLIVLLCLIRACPTPADGCNSQLRFNDLLRGHLRARCQGQPGSSKVVNCAIASSSYAPEVTANTRDLVPNPKSPFTRLQAFEAFN